MTLDSTTESKIRALNPRAFTRSTDVSQKDAILAAISDTGTRNLLKQKPPVLIVSDRVDFCCLGKRTTAFYGGKYRLPHWRRIQWSTDAAAVQARI